MAETPRWQTQDVQVVLIHFERTAVVFLPPAAPGIRGDGGVVVSVETVVLTSLDGDYLKIPLPAHQQSGPLPEHWLLQLPLAAQLKA